MSGVNSAAQRQISHTSVLSDKTHQRIKKMIFSYEISPGSRVNMDALSLSLKVSHTPIREALARLESEGLVIKTPLKGYKASDLLSLAEFNDLFQFRLLIEPWAAEHAAKKIDVAGKKALRDEIAKTKQTLKIRQGEEFEYLTEHDARFHTLVAELSGSKTIESAFERTHCHLHLFRLFMAHKLHLIENNARAKFVQNLFEQYYQNGSGQLAIIEHTVIAQAIIKGDAKAARVSMHSHIQASLKRFSSSAEEINQL